jgi:DNA-binding response OmpR family regulator
MCSATREITHVLQRVAIAVGMFTAEGCKASGYEDGRGQRIHSALGWGRERGLEKLHIGDLEIDLMRQRAVRAGGRLDLTHKEFLLLSLLARRAGEVLSRTFIADQVWDT